MNDLSFLSELEAVIAERLAQPSESSYTARLAEAGRVKVAQKVAEEAVELALAGACEADERVSDEAADLLYHLLVMLKLRGLGIGDAVAVLERRHRERG